MYESVIKKNLSIIIKTKIASYKNVRCPPTNTFPKMALFLYLASYLATSGYLTDFQIFDMLFIKLSFYE